MDPNKLLKRLRDSSDALIEAVDELEEVNQGQSDRDSVSLMEAIREHGSDLAEGFQDLDKWLKKGGFLPKRWKQ